MITVDMNNSTPSSTTAHQFVTEASDLRIPPGAVPRELNTTLGNGQPFVLFYVDDEGNMRYRQRFGSLELMVFND